MRLAEHPIDNEVLFRPLQGGVYHTEHVISGGVPPTRQRALEGVPPIPERMGPAVGSTPHTLSGSRRGSAHDDEQELQLPRQEVAE